MQGKNGVRFCKQVSDVRKLAEGKFFLEFLKQGAIYPLNGSSFSGRPPWLSSLKKYSHKHIINQVKGLSVILGKVPMQRITKGGWGLR